MSIRFILFLLDSVSICFVCTQFKSKYITMFPLNNIRRINCVSLNNQNVQLYYITSHLWFLSKYSGVVETVV